MSEYWHFARWEPSGDDVSRLVRDLREATTKAEAVWGELIVRASEGSFVNRESAVNIYLKKLQERSKKLERLLKEDAGAPATQAEPASDKIEKEEENSESSLETVR